MTVDTYTPPPDHPLHPYLGSIWCCGARGAFRRETVLPKGNVDVIFNLADPILFIGERRPDAGEMKQAAYLAGPQVGPIETRPRDEVLLMGISLRMEGCRALVPLPLHELTDRTVDAAPIFGDATELLHRLGEARGFQERCAILLRWLARRIAPEPRAERLRAACSQLAALPSDPNLNRIAADLGMSGRHLRRLFLHHFGIGPAHYLRLRRFVDALHLMPGESSLTEIAHAVHYYDQAHFCRDFKELAGMTPSEYRAQAGHVPGHLFLL